MPAPRCIDIRESLLLAYAEMATMQHHTATYMFKTYALSISLSDLYIHLLCMNTGSNCIRRPIRTRGVLGCQELHVVPGGLNRLSDHCSCTRVAFTSALVPLIAPIQHLLGILEVGRTCASVYCLSATYRTLYAVPDDEIYRIISMALCDGRVRGSALLTRL
jgi:hypothetical protein